MRRRIMVQTSAGLALIAIVMAAYLLWARPYQLHWGATPAEIVRTMPGDQLDAEPTFLATRTITISGTPPAIWPWLLQTGHDRAGAGSAGVIIGHNSPGPLAAKASVATPRFPP